jgi:hypothetical protein
MICLQLQLLLLFLSLRDNAHAALSRATLFNDIQLSATNAIVLNDSVSRNVGVKFQTTVEGLIGSILFLKKGESTTRQCTLWIDAEEGATMLASATILKANEEKDGAWQICRFLPPVDVRPDLTYVASVFTAGGYATQNYFLGKNNTVGPDGGLILLGEGINAPSNVETSESFPEVISNTNFWVDVVFTFDSSATTTTPSPTNGQTSTSTTTTPSTVENSLAMATKTTAPNSAALIGGIVGGIGGLFLLIAVAVACAVKRRGQRNQTSAGASIVVNSNQTQYGSAAQANPNLYGDVDEVREPVQY